jgi:hypothetical protein
VEQYSIVKAIDQGEWRWSIPKVQVELCTTKCNFMPP